MEGSGAVYLVICSEEADAGVRGRDQGAGRFGENVPRAPPY